MRTLEPPKWSPPVPPRYRVRCICGALLEYMNEDVHAFNVGALVVCPHCGTGLESRGEHRVATADGVVYEKKES